jgi:hypothetical protein
MPRSNGEVEMRFAQEIFGFTDADRADPDRLRTGAI